MAYRARLQRRGTGGGPEDVGSRALGINLRRKIAIVEICCRVSWSRAKLILYVRAHCWNWDDGDESLAI